MISVYKDFDDVPEGLEKEGYSSKEVMARLKEIYHGKCAFTEQKIIHFAITYYRPKKLYPWLANEWSNLLPVNQAINRYIDSKFPTENEKINQVPTDKKELKVDSETLLSEKPLLLHPEVDIPENYLYVSSTGTIQAYTEKGRITIEMCNLNIENLVKSRFSKIVYFNELFTDAHKQYENYEKSENLFIKQVLQSIFKSLENSTLPQKEFSLTGISMLENFEDMTIRYFQVRKYPNLLRKAYRHYILHPFIWKDKKIPYLEFEQATEIQEQSIPIGITALAIQKYHFIKKVEIAEIPIDTRWIFFTGENGFGKSLLLQSFYLACLGKKDGAMLLADENSRFTLHWKKYNTPELQIIGNNNGVKFLRNHVVAYGANRLNIGGNLYRENQAPQKESKSDSLFKNKGSLGNILVYLTRLHDRPQKDFQERFDNIVLVLKKLLPSISSIEIDDTQPEKRVFFREKAENGDILKRISFGALSAGNRSIIAMIGDMMVDFFNHQPEITHPSNFEGIVIIEEIDIHLHPKWQRELVKSLTEIFPKLQFIASTHSSIPLLGTPEETLIFNVEKPNRKIGIQVTRLDIDVSQLIPNTILSSPIFDLDSILSVNHQDGEKSCYRRSFDRKIQFQSL